MANRNNSYYGGSTILTPYRKIQEEGYEPEVVPKSHSRLRKKSKKKEKSKKKPIKLKMIDRKIAQCEKKVKVMVEKIEDYPDKGDSKIQSILETIEALKKQRMKILEELRELASKKNSSLKNNPHIWGE